MTKLSKNDKMKESDKDMKLEDITKNIQEKLGKETSSKIADDIAKIITYDNAIQKDLKNRDDEIVKLKKDKDMLIEANGNLLQQIPFGKDEDKEDKKVEEPKNFDFKSIFDKNGFKR